MADGIVVDTHDPSHLFISTSSSQVLISSLALLNSSLVMWILDGRTSQVLSSLVMEKERVTKDAMTRVWRMDMAG